MERSACVGEVMSAVDAAMRVCFGCMIDGSVCRSAQGKASANLIASVYTSFSHVVPFLNRVVHRQACTHVKSQ
jgi:hypothetical protein